MKENDANDESDDAILMTIVTKTATVVAAIRLMTILLSLSINNDVFVTVIGDNVSNNFCYEEIK